jgi:D-inositol-3-phosphate glycosyltransferase
MTKVMRTGSKEPAALQVGLLTGGNDRPYALGMAAALAGEKIVLDFVGSDALEAPELHDSPLINFLNLRGNQDEQADLPTKVVRLLTYYARLAHYAAVSRSRILHILWNNKFEFVDRVLLMAYYRLLGKRIVLTAHNVNAAKRDGKDSVLNRLTLKFQYWMSHHIFVHTEKMKTELARDFDCSQRKVTVIPFGINNTIPKSELKFSEAKTRLGLSADSKVLLFFGQIAPYKGLEYLVAAMGELCAKDAGLNLIIAGKVKKGYAVYWQEISSEIERLGIGAQVVQKIGFVPDDEVESYFKAADVVILPYVEIFQSGLPFLAYSFGLPVIATDVGSLREDVIEGKTGFLCQAQDSAALAKAIQDYFCGDLYRQLDAKRGEIKDFANEKYSWGNVGRIIRNVYDRLLLKVERERHSSAIG